MSWSSDIRCLYCDGRLPLYRKITSGQFCSATHRKLYWQEQERLAVERLHQTHDSLRAFRPPEGVEAILGPTPGYSSSLDRLSDHVNLDQDNVYQGDLDHVSLDHGTLDHFSEEPPQSGVLVPRVEPKSDEAPGLLAAEPFSYEADLAPQVPLWAPEIAGHQEVYAPAPLAGLIPLHSAVQPRWPADRLEAAEPKPLPVTGLVRVPIRPASSLIADVLAAGIAKMFVEPRHYQTAHRVEPLETAVLPCRDVALSAAPQGYDPKAVEAEEEKIPFAGKLPVVVQFEAREDSAKRARRDPWPAAPFSVVQRAQLPLGAMQYGITLAPAAPLLAGLRRLSIDQVPLVHGTWIDSLRALGAEASTESPRYELSTPALRPRLRLAAGSRYSVPTRDAVFTVAAIEPENLQPSGKEIAIPERKAMGAAAGASSPGRPAIEIPVPGTAGLIPLSCAKPNEPVAPHTVQSVNLPQPLWTPPVRPASHLEPLDAKPVADFMAPAPPVAEKKDQSASLGIAAPPPEDEAPSATPWMQVTGFWKHAPRDLKLLVFGIPILLGLALHPSLKKVPFAAPPQVGGMQHNFESKLNDQWVNVKQTMVDRAAIALDEDFRAGLDDWTSRGGTTEWAFDATGFVRPGPLALYRPSIDLTDYQLQFLGMIDKKALSWVVRAADFDDYYVVKLVVLKPGPVPTVGVTRYAVVHGVAQDRADTIAFINAREDMLYRVRMDIHGDIFSLMVQGQMVDSWSEPRLRKGGVGFFTARGEASRLRWVQVTHQYDMLGRLCAYLAPYNIPSTNGGWQP